MTLTETASERRSLLTFQAHTLLTRFFLSFNNVSGLRVGNVSCLGAVIVIARGFVFVSALAEEMSLDEAVLIVGVKVLMMMTVLSTF